MADPNSARKVSHLQRYSVALLSALIVAVIAFLVIVESRDTSSNEAANARPLTKPIRARVESPESYVELLRALRIYHYNPKPRSEKRFRDVFYDTPGRTLHQRGDSIRVRERIGKSGESRYSLQIEHDFHPTPDGSTKLNVDLPDGIGGAIASNTLEVGLSRLAARLEGEPAEQIRARLQAVDIRPGELEAWLAADVDRKTLDVSDKGRSWFELRHEVWRFRTVGRPEDERSISFEDVVIDTQLDRDDPELYRRVQTMRALVTMVDGIAPVSTAPHERAIEAFGLAGGARPSMVEIAESDRPMNICAIDMGSNSFKRIVGSFQAGRYLQHGMVKKTLGVGDDLARHGRISDPKLAEIEQTLSEFKVACESDGTGRVLAIGTAAFREAPNGGRAVEIAAKLGIPMEIASEERESKLAYLVGSLGQDGYAVIDNGSRSIELASKQSGREIRYSVFNLGYRVAFAEYFAGAEDPRAAIAAFRGRLHKETANASFMADHRKLLGVEFEEMAEVLFPPAATEERFIALAVLNLKVEEIAAADAETFSALVRTLDMDRALPRLVVAATLAEKFGYDGIELTARELGTGLIIEAGMERNP